MLIIEYRNNWPEDFLKIKNVLQRTLSGLEITIEHIGSTAIPFLAAKPIVDIDVIYNKKVSFGQIKHRLTELGYFHNGNQGINEREVFKRHKTVEHKILDAISHHLYVCPVNSEELEKHLLFRDYLRNNDSERLEYQKLKYVIAEEAKNDRKKYAAIKEVKAEDFIEQIIAKAKNKDKFNL
ncbi:GrpB family protein [Pedobacter aquatilis]|uniref:GrpB family protein n=1 Tax=Pedobacter aquatilis TaxID=351343 RepID=UPI0025B3BE54|nr:GrpB family protein [Pedobacter aquatilis]MDN3588872.1 GrpB family protein [Pedobacter aquatilis]